MNWTLEPDNYYNLTYYIIRFKGRAICTSCSWQRALELVDRLNEKGKQHD